MHFGWFTLFSVLKISIGISSWSVSNMDFVTNKLHWLLKGMPILLVHIISSCTGDAYISCMDLILYV